MRAYLDRGTDQVWTTATGRVTFGCVPPASTRFPVAVHALCLLALHHPEPVTSDAMAASMNTHPVVARRVCGLLRRAALVDSTVGVGGGWTLRRDARDIDLATVATAVGRDSPPAVSGRGPNPACTVGRGITRALAVVLADAEAAREAQLRTVSVADVLAMVTAAA